MLTHIYELGSQSMPASLHSYSVTCAHAHIRVGLAINACPSTLVFSVSCSRTYELGSNQCMPPLHSSSVTGAHAHIRVGLAINACPFTGTCALAYIRVGLAYHACPSTLVFSDWCSCTHTSWASNQCLPLYTRIQRLVLTHIYESG